MTDFFGIGVAIKGAIQTYFRAARGTGRTTTLVHSVKKGDRVVFNNYQEAKRFERLLKDRDIEGVETFVVDPRQPSRLFDRGSSVGRTIFDHSWLEEYFLQSHERAMKDIMHLQTETSGYGEAHIQTKLKAQQAQKWNIYE